MCCSNPFRLRALVRVFLLGLFALGLCWMHPAAAAPQVPGKAANQPIALVGGTIHPITGPVIEQGVLLIENGCIAAAGRRVQIPDGARRIDVSGRHVYPGLISAYTQLGLVEIAAVRATRDYHETGWLNPNVRAERAVNPDSELIPVTRAGGVLVALAAPSGGLISGTSAVLQLDGWTWEQMTVLAPAALHINWPSVPAVARLPDDGDRSAQSAENPLERLEKAMADAQAYRRARADDPEGKKHAFDARWEAMLPVLEGKLPVVATANELQQIQSAVAFCQRHGLRLIVLGGYDAPDCASLLKKHKVPVIVETTHRLPLRRSDPYDAAYTVPARLSRAGVQFCIASKDTSNARNLPYEAAMAVGFGLPRDEALKAITIWPAEILGVADRVGSLQEGKQATLIVTDGDPLEATTRVHMAFIQGRGVDLSNRHQQLWQKYRQKYQ